MTGVNNVVTKGKSLRRHAQKLLVLLNKTAFARKSGSSLECAQLDQFTGRIRAAMQDGYQVLLVHDRRGMRNSYPFADVFLAASEALREDAPKLFNTIALPWHHEPHEAACMVAIAEALKAEVGSRNTLTRAALFSRRHVTRLQSPHTHPGLPTLHSVSPGACLLPSHNDGMPPLRLPRLQRRLASSPPGAPAVH